MTSASEPFVLYGSKVRIEKLLTLCATGEESNPAVTSIFNSVLRIFDIYMRRSELQSEPIGRALRCSQHVVADHGLKGLLAHWKWKTAACFAAAHEQPLPDRPGSCSDESPFGILGGSYYRFTLGQSTIIRDCRLQHDRCRYARCKAARSFFNSILMLKKGFPRPDKALLDDAVVAFGPNLSQLRNTRSELPDLSTGQLASQVRRTVREVFRGAIDLCTSFPVPSSSAHFMLGCKKGGAFGSFYRRFGTSLQKCWDVNTGELRSDVELPKALSQTLAKMPRPSFITWEDECIQNQLLDFRELDKWCKEHWDGWSREFDLLDSRVSPVALAEPLKIRTISCGPSDLYWALKPIQQLTWRAVKRHRVFRLIGEPCSNEVLSSCFKNGLLPGNSWVSADYKSATDFLDPALSNAAVEEVCDILNVSNEIRDAYHRSLTGHMVPLTVDLDAPPTCGGRCSDFVEQQWGQLMGSPTSFPILCLVNAALTRYALERSRSRVTGRRCYLPLKGMLVNGDDLLFQCDEETYRTWWETVNAGGLVPSVGKNYFSPDFVVINSTYYYYNRLPTLQQWDSDSDGGSSNYLRSYFEEVPFVNLGLLYGLKRSGDDDDTSDVVTSDEYAMGDCAHDFEKGFSDFGLKYLLRHLFRHYALDDLKSFPGSWYLPRVFGGLGLPCDPVELTDWDRKLAAHVMRSHEKIFMFRGKVSDFPLFQEVGWHLNEWRVDGELVACGERNEAAGAPEFLSGVAACDLIRGGGDVTREEPSKLSKTERISEETNFRRKVLKKLRQLTKEAAMLPLSSIEKWTAERILAVRNLSISLPELVRQPIRYFSQGTISPPPPEA
jgi:hypothetical protein